MSTKDELDPLTTIKNKLESVMPNHIILRFITDPTLQSTSKSLFIDGYTLIAYIFAILITFSSCAKWDMDSLTENYKKAVQYIFSISIVMKNQGNQNMVGLPQFYFTIITSFLGICYYFSIYIYFKQGYLNTFSRFMVYLIDNSISIVCVIFLPSSVVSEFLLGYNFSNDVATIMAFANLVVYPAFVVSLYRRFAFLTEPGLPFVTCNPKNGLIYVFALSLCTLATTLEEWIDGSLNLVYPLFTALSLFIAIWVYYHPFFLTRYVCILVQSLPLVLSYSYLLTYIFKFIRFDYITIIIYISTGYIILLGIGIALITFSIKKATTVLKNEEILEPSKYTSKEIFYILQSASITWNSNSIKFQKIFDFDFCIKLLKSHPQDPFLAYHAMHLLIKTPKNHQKLYNLAKELISMNSNSLFHTSSLLGIASISSGTTEYSNKEYIDNTLIERMMEPCFIYKRDTWRSLLNNNPNFAIRALFELTSLEWSYISFFKQKRAFTSALNMFVNEISFDYSILPKSADPDPELIAKSKLGNDYRAKDEIPSRLCLDFSIVVSFLMLISQAAITLYFMILLISYSPKIFDVEKSINGLYSISLMAIVENPNETEIKENIERNLYDILSTLFCKIHIDQNLLLQFADVCYSLGIKSLENLTETEEGNEILLNGANISIQVVNDSIKGINHFMEQIDDVIVFSNYFIYCYFLVIAAFVIIAIVLMEIGLHKYRKIMNCTSLQLFRIPIQKVVNLFNDRNSKTEKEFDFSPQASFFGYEFFKFNATFILLVVVNIGINFWIGHSIDKLGYVLKSTMNYEYPGALISSLAFFLPFQVTDKIPEQVSNATNDVLLFLGQIASSAYRQYSYTKTIARPMLKEIIYSELYPLKNETLTYRFLDSLKEIRVNFITLHLTEGKKSMKTLHRVINRHRELSVWTSFISDSLKITGEIAITDLILSIFGLLVALLLISGFLMYKLFRNRVIFFRTLKIVNRFLVICCPEVFVDENGKPDFESPPNPSFDLDVLDKLPDSFFFYDNEKKVIKQNTEATKRFGNQTGLDIAMINNVPLADEHGNEKDYRAIHVYGRKCFPRQYIGDQTDEGFVVVHDITMQRSMEIRKHQLDSELVGMTKASVYLPLESDSILIRNAAAVEITCTFHSAEVLSKIKETLNSVTSNYRTIYLFWISNGYIYALFAPNGAFSARTNKVHLTEAADFAFSLIGLLENEGIEVKSVVHLLGQALVIKHGDGTNNVHVYSPQGWIGSILMRNVEQGEVCVERSMLKNIINQHSVVRQGSQNVMNTLIEYIVMK